MTSPHPILSILGFVIVAMSIAAFLIWVERRLLALWHMFHVPLSGVLFTLAGIHIVAAMYYATLLK